MTQRYTVFTHLLDANDQIVAQMDSEPQGGGLPTDRWQVGEIVVDTYGLELLPDVLQGSYTLEVGMYLWITGDRLAASDPITGDSFGDRVLLGSVQVVGQ
jgi:hypothetical protein